MQFSTRIVTANIWWSKFHSNPMSQEAGLRYPKMILELGGSQDDRESLVDFLGWEPRLEIYLRYLHIKRFNTWVQ